MKFFQKKIIGPAENPLLVRYILFRCAAFGVFLHHMLRSDHERALHDHPWPFVSVVLRGGYFEHHDQTLDRTETVRWHKPGSVLVRPAEWRHRFQLANSSRPFSLIKRFGWPTLEQSLYAAGYEAVGRELRTRLPNTAGAFAPRDAWTLVFVGRRARRWGFFVPKEEDALGNRRFTWCWWRRYNPELGICEEYVRTTEGED